MSFETLARLLEHPAIWRGSGAAQVGGIPTGYAALDAGLPGHGWPSQGLIEILSPRLGCGELHLILPLLAALTGKSEGRWCAWITPPHEPFAPALAACGVSIDRLLVVRAVEPLWAFEQSLGMGACEIALAWPEKVNPRCTRRLQLAAERGHALGVLFRSASDARRPSAAMLRLLIEPSARGIRVRLLKSRGGSRDSIALSWNEDHVLESG